jgi:hypothetical protein
MLRNGLSAAEHWFFVFFYFVIFAIGIKKQRDDKDASNFFG